MLAYFIILAAGGHWDGLAARGTDVGSEGRENPQPCLAVTLLEFRERSRCQRRSTRQKVGERIKGAGLKRNTVKVFQKRGFEGPLQVVC